jgi:N-acetyl-anhydromuramyl-L-alanine amidase AmpD
MAQSPEYPDLKWVPPKSWTNANRTYVQLIVIHTTEGSSRAQSAEDGAAYDARRTDKTSTHYFHDSNSTVQCVRTEDIAHTAKGEGNRRGIQHELCGRAGWTRAQWDTAYARAMLARTAKQAARDVRKWRIPVRHLTVAEVRNGVKGFCSHHDISLAFGQSNHTDPGPNFPWTKFLDLVRAELAPPKPTPEVPMASQFSDDDLKAIRLQSQLGVYDALQRGSNAADEDPATAEDATGRQIRNFIDNLSDFSSGIGADLPQIKDRLEALEAKADEILAALAEGDVDTSV